MPDFSLASLGAGMPPQQQSLANLGQSPDQSLLAMMLEKQRRQQEPRLYMRELNPGVTWGGRDRNAIQPDDVMRSYFMPAPTENI